MKKVMKLMAIVLLFAFSNNSFGQNSKTFIDGARTASALCNNEDFESQTQAPNTVSPITIFNQISGWTVDNGENQFPNNSCNLGGCCPNTPSASALITPSTAGYADPVIGSQYLIYSMFGTTNNNGLAVNPQVGLPMYGNNILRLNNSVSDYSTERLTKTYSVTSNNFKFQFAYIAVFSPTHTCCDASSFRVAVTDATANMTLCCPSYSVSGPNSQCTGTTSVQYYVAGSNTPYNGSNDTLIYNKWEIVTFDLSSYIGSIIQIEIIASDCNAGDHYGYVYFDAQCGSGALGIPNNGAGIQVEKIRAIPNPFKHETSIEYYLGQAGPCTFEIHDITGRIIYKETFISKVGKNSITWNVNDINGSKCDAGVYLATIESEKAKINLKLVIE